MNTPADNKNRIAAAAVPIVLIAVSMIAVLAYLMALSNREINSVTVGYDSIEVVEDFKPPEKQEVNTEYKKTVQIRNNGTVPCFVRVYVEFSSSAVRECSELSCDGGSTFYPADNSSENAFIKNLPDNWVFVSDTSDKLSGYFYYTKPLLTTGSSVVTAPLFTHVRTTYSDAADITQYDIIVYSESVQTIAKNGSDLAASSSGWREAWNEFLETND